VQALEDLGVLVGDGADAQRAGGGRGGGAAAAGHRGGEGDTGAGQQGAAGQRGEQGLGFGATRPGDAAGAHYVVARGEGAVTGDLRW
jgi:hypothetical protein